eukprot:TRINITY_DN2796_c0_g1_i1.p1 TRINITY_DN2796_c0_g1~~TRINITY_DN2796_c0_g1_i1.p1  ORF type:complete len:359 (+),score=45.87 TRINITY_DN2796_c0_g1_i1:61-1137(+)
MTSQGEKEQQEAVLVVCSATDYDREFFSRAEASGAVSESGITRIAYESAHLHAGNAAEIVKRHGAVRGVCAFVNDTVCRETAAVLAGLGVTIVVLRCTGFDRVDVAGCEAAGLSVARVPVYSPQAVAEHAVALALCVNRRLVTAVARNARGRFALTLDLMGSVLCGRTVGLLGTGAIGRAAGRAFMGLGCRILCHDVRPSADFAALPGVTYADLHTVVRSVDLLSIHLPLLPSTRHLIDAPLLREMRKGAILVNTSRGALVDTRALIDAVNDGHLAGAGVDVYEDEAKYFFANHDAIEDPLLAELANTPNIVLTAHQAFFTIEAVSQIVAVTIQNLREHIKDKKSLRQMTNHIFHVYP